MIEQPHHLRGERVVSNIEVHHVTDRKGPASVNFDTQAIVGKVDGTGMNVLPLVREGTGYLALNAVCPPFFGTISAAELNAAVRTWLE